MYCIEELVGAGEQVVPLLSSRRRRRRCCGGSRRVWPTVERLAVPYTRQVFIGTMVTVPRCVSGPEPLSAAQKTMQTSAIMPWRRRPPSARDDHLVAVSVATQFFRP